MGSATVERIRELRRKVPFEPFRLVACAGEKYMVLDPDKLAIAETRLLHCVSVTERVTIVEFAKPQATEVFKTLAMKS